MLHVGYRLERYRRLHPVGGWLLDSRGGAERPVIKPGASPRLPDLTGNVAVGISDPEGGRGRDGMGCSPAGERLCNYLDIRTNHHYCLYFLL